MIQKLISTLSRPKSFVILFIGCVCVLLPMRTLFSQRFFRPHDFTHAARIAEMQRSLLTGEFPVRWSHNLGFGFGMPLFNFYAPLPYYIAQIPYNLGVSVTDSIKILYLLSSIISFVSMYLLVKELTDSKGGIVAAIVFSFSTYRALDLFVRGALGEVWALSLIPFVLWGVTRIFRNKPHGVLITIIGLVATLLSHNLIGMLTFGLAAFYGAWLSIAPALVNLKSIRPIRNLKIEHFVRNTRFPHLFTAFVLAIGLTAFYSLPSFFEKDQTRVEETITTGYFAYDNHFVYLRQLVQGTWGYGGSIPGLEDGVSFSLGIFTILLGLFGCTAVLVKGTRKQRITAIFFFILTAGSIFMLTGHSRFIWNSVGILKFLQFPWRFLTFTHIGLSVLAGFTVVWISKHKLFLPVTVILLILLVIRQAPLFKPENLLLVSQLEEFYDVSPGHIIDTISFTLPDYLPKEILDTNLPVPIHERITPTAVGSSASIIKSIPTSLTATLVCPKEECRFVINTFRFPGWQATINGKYYQLLHAVHLPVYEVVVPNGEHALVVQLENTPIRLLGNILSLLSLGILAAFILIPLRQKSKTSL